MSSAVRSSSLDNERNSAAYGNVFWEPVLALYLQERVPVLALYLLGVFKTRTIIAGHPRPEECLRQPRERELNEKGGGKVGALPSPNRRTDQSGVVCTLERA